MSSPAFDSFAVVLTRLAEIQRAPLSRTALRDGVEAAQQAGDDPQRQLAALSEQLDTAPPVWLKQPDPASVPALLQDDARGWGILLGRNGRQQWVCQHWNAETRQWEETAVAELDQVRVASIRLRPVFRAGNSPVLALVIREITAHRTVLLEGALAGLMIGLVGLAISFYSMQVYDRVIPTGAMQTLFVLSTGALLAVGLEWLTRSIRAHLYERLIDAVDQRLARAVYLRLLDIRLDQFPQSVGTLAGQMRGYETVRGFLTQATGSVLVDLPFALLFLVLIVAIAGWLAWIPLSFLIASTLLGLSIRQKMEALSRIGTAAGNFKTGLLVESVEGAETLKSGQGGWRMLSRWLKSTNEARDVELQMRRLTERFQHAMGGMQQIAYILMVASGAWLVSKGNLTMGGLLACSILSGRVLNPVAVIAAQSLQWANAKAALEGLDAIWRLEDDHGGHEPVVIDEIAGHYRIENVEVRYAQIAALKIAQLAIRPGEKIGIIGPVGAGKTTLLRLLSGMYKPQQGQVFLDDVDLAHIAKPVLAHHLGYLQQDGRLFAGTLRENLLLGMIDPGDSQILDAARRTGLLESVIAGHPKGLEQPIFEGGSGLSGGQRQLVNLTRVLLRQPRIWLLDEPTASVDGNTEQKLLTLFKECVGSADTLIVVTHKPEMLQLVDRLIVVAGHGIFLDGPVAQVLARLNAPQNGSAQ